MLIYILCLVVDLVSHKLTESLKRHKEKMVDRNHSVPGIAELTAIADDE